MAHERLRPEYHFDEEKLKQLRQIAPECFEDGKINFTTLRQNLGDWAEDEDDDTIEHFGLFWPGKKDARRVASLPPEGTLEPMYGEGLKPDGTPDTDGQNDSKNIFIEGENLEVLKILQKSYANRVKMIYIDPPYNTGNDFVYDDNFTEPLQEYLRRTGQVDEEGKPLTTNKKSDGRFHSKWLSMMYPRLRLARNLLSDDGAFFVNIDDNEAQHLKMIINEIFGEENFLGNVIWKHTEQSKNDEPFFSRQYNHLLVYRKSDSLSSFRFPRSDKDNKNYSNPDNDPRDKWRSGDVRSPNYRKTLCYPIETPSGKAIPPPENGWRWSETVVKEKIASGEIIFNEDETKIIRKIYLENQEGRTPENLWQGEQSGTTRQANAEIKELFEGQVVFDTPKPTQLIVRILELFFSEKDFLVLDFFSGSGTTGEAVMKLNKNDGGTRRCISVQLPEAVESSTIAAQMGFKSISDVTRQRLINASEKYNYKEGFRYFKLTRSCLMPWTDFHGGDSNQLQEALELFNQSPLIEHWNTNRLLCEISLHEGFPLDSSMQEVLGISENQVVRLSSETCEHDLLICLNETIAKETVDKLDLEGNDLFICLDSAIEDQLKLRLSDKGFIKTI